jgi:hypothetical protein
MVFSPVLSYPTIDKIELITDNFYLSQDNYFRNLPEYFRGEKVREKSIYNSPICNMTVKPDFHNVPTLKLSFNPNKNEIEQVQKECRRVGIDFPILESKLVRVDIERHQQLQFGLIGYHSILGQSKSGKHINAIVQDSFRIGSESNGIQFYDKSAQLKLETPKIIRAETQIKGMEYLKKNGITTMETLLNADVKQLMKLYNQPKVLYLRNLEKMQGNSSIDIGSHVRHLEELERDKTIKNFFITFLSHLAINSKPIEDIFSIIDSSSLPHNKKTNCRNYLRKLSIGVSTPDRQGMIKELLSYFKLSA